MLTLLASIVHADMGGQALAGGRLCVAVTVGTGLKKGYSIRGLGYRTPVQYNPRSTSTSRPLLLPPSWHWDGALAVWAPPIRQRTEFGPESVGIRIDQGPMDHSKPLNPSQKILRMKYDHSNPEKPAI